MDSKIQILYTQLTREDREKVDAKIRELFTLHQLDTKDCSNVQQQEDHR